MPNLKLPLGTRVRATANCSSFFRKGDTGTIAVSPFSGKDTDADSRGQWIQFDAPGAYGDGHWYSVNYEPIDESVCPHCGKKF